MEQKNYQCSIEVNADAEKAYKVIADVSGWWAKNFKGSALKAGDTFRVEFGDTSVDFKISEAKPGERVVWAVTDCYLHWLNDKKEWNGTEVIWQLSKTGNGTKIDMEHIGLKPAVACYKDCEQGWNGHIKESLLNLVNKGVGQPQ